MKKSNNYAPHLMIGIFLAASITSFPSCYKSSLIEPSKPAPMCWQYDHTYESDDTQYYNGEVLLPDYVHTDTLIVTNAALLNEQMQRTDIASDSDIAEILAQSTIDLSYWYFLKTEKGTMIDFDTDERGLISITYIDNNRDTFALDYLSPYEYLLFTDK